MSAQFEMVRSVAKDLERRLDEDGEVTMLMDGSQAQLEVNYYGGYTLSSTEQDDDGPVWTVTARADSAFLDMLNPTLIFLMQSGDQAYSLHHTDEPLPEWAFPILGNIVQLDLTE